MFLSSARRACASDGQIVGDETQDSHHRCARLSEAFGVAKATMGSKARQVRDRLRISPFSPEFERADVAARNPLKWIIEVDGLAVDVRHVPLEMSRSPSDASCTPFPQRSLQQSLTNAA
jgi:Domain of unknown function (DUF6398)